MKQRIVNYLLRHLLNVVLLEDVIEDRAGKLYIGKKEVGADELRSLAAEVKALKGFKLWSIMNETVREKAMDLGFNKSTSFDDLKTCKLMLYNLDILNSICTTIESREKRAR